MNDLTLITCSFNTPEVTLTMLKSFAYVHTHTQRLMLVENSTNDETQKLLNKNMVPFIRLGTQLHSESVERALYTCTTKYALLVDTDIIFKKNIQPIYDEVKEYDLTLAGEICGDRGGKKLKKRAHPWFCFVNVDNIKSEYIHFYDKQRLGGEYDVGAAFFEDIEKARKFKIGYMKCDPMYFVHYEGMSWRTQKYDPTKMDTHSLDFDVNGTHNNAALYEYGKKIENIYFNEIKRYAHVDITKRFTNYKGHYEISTPMPN